MAKRRGLGSSPEFEDNVFLSDHLCRIQILPSPITRHYCISHSTPTLCLPYSATMSRHRLFRGDMNGVEAAFDDGYNDRWDVSEATHGASPASPTSARYMRRAARSNVIGEGTKVRAVFDFDGEWYDGRVVRVMTGGRYGVQFDGYDDWEICTQVQKKQSPERPAVGSPRSGSNKALHPAAPTSNSTSALPTAGTNNTKEPWDLKLVQKEMPAVRAVVGEGIPEAVVMEAIRRCNYNPERAILELIEDGSTFAVPISINGASNSGGGRGSNGLGAALSKSNDKKTSGLGAALAQQGGGGGGGGGGSGGGGGGGGGSNDNNGGGRFRSNSNSASFGSPDSPRRSRTFSDSCELSDLDALIASNPKTTKHTNTKETAMPTVPKVARTTMATTTTTTTKPKTTKKTGGETKSSKRASTQPKTPTRKKTNLDKLRQQSKSNTPKKISKSDLTKRQKLIDEWLRTKQSATSGAGTSADTQQHKPILNMVVIGHVDAGKSTMMGHLLWKLGEIDKRTMRKFEKESSEIGKSSFKYAWALDEQGEERERGVTIDVATKNFNLPNRQVVLLDAPGHKDFIPNMISGASQADVALLVVAAGEDEFASGFVGGGQTKEHLVLVRSMGIKQLVIAVNKMDMVHWSQERYKQVIASLTPFLLKTGFKQENVRYVPVSGLGGENLIVRNSEGPLSEWSGTWGPTLAECINEYKPSNRDRVMKKPLRMSIADVYKHPRMGAMTVSGRIQTGTLVTGDQVRVMPVYELCTVKAMCDHTGVPCKVAIAGTNVEVGLVGLDSDMMLGVGALLCDPHHTIPLVRKFNARIQTLDTLKIPIIKGSKFTMHVHNTDVPIHVSKLIEKRSRKEATIKKKPRTVGRDEIGLVTVVVNSSICLETFEDYPAMGRVLLRDNGVTVAMGTVTKIKE